VRLLRRAAGWSLALAAAGAWAAPDKPPPANLAQLFARAQPLPALVSAARAGGFALTGVDRGRDGPPARGDQAVALVSYAAAPGTEPVQWLLRLTLDQPGDPAAKGQDVTFYSTVGDRFVFHSAAKAAIDLDLLGPTGAGAVPAAPRRQVRASAGYLMLDISRGAAAIHRIRVQIKDRPPAERGNFGIASVPFPAAQVEKDRRQLEPYHLDEGDRRSFAGMMPALAEFLNLVRDTPGLQEILWKVFEGPSLLDMIRKVGNPNASFTIDYADAVDTGDLFWPAAAERPPAQLMRVTFQIFGKPALRIALMAVAPRPPLEVTAGVVAAAAWGPSHPERTVAVRVVSARASR